jgi:exodeoxyribonuclease VII small subunit
MPPKKAAEAPSFTESAQAVDDILEQFKSEALPLEDALKLFEDGVRHLKVCREKLTEARGRVEELVKAFDSDEPGETREFELE